MYIACVCVELEWKWQDNFEFVKGQFFDTKYFHPISLCVFYNSFHFAEIFFYFTYND